LEWDKGPITEEETLVARDLAEMKTRRMQRAELRQLEKRRGREGELSEVAEVIMNGLRRVSEKRSDRQLRPRKEITSVHKGRTVPGGDNFDEVVPSEAVRSMEAAKKCGFNRVVIAPSTIEGAGLGLFLSRDKVKAGGLITSYEGERLTQKQADEEGRDLAYVYCSGKDPEGHMRYDDALAPDNCFGRCSNDPRDDHLDNAKEAMKGGRLILIATVDINEGDEIFLNYGVEYWLDRFDLVAPEAAKEEYKRAKRMGLDVEGVKRVKVKRMSREAFETKAPKRRGRPYAKP
jgi:hypothetical protein